MTSADNPHYNEYLVATKHLFEVESFNTIRITIISEPRNSKYIHPDEIMMSFFAAAVIACALLQVKSFSFSRNVVSRSSLSILRMAEDYAVVHADAKSSLLSDISAYSRTQMNEYVLALEKVNPTQEPAKAALLNGVWEIVATGFGSPGIIGLQVIKAIPGGVVDVNGKIATCMKS